jgi:hypothetical protein
MEAITKFNEPASMQQEPSCSQTHRQRIFLFGDSFDVWRCTHNGEQCFRGLPTDSCDGLAEFCNYFTFGKDPNTLWTTYICQKPWENGYCYEPGNRPRCEDVTAVQVSGRGVKICTVDEYGVEQCNYLSDGQNVSAMDASDDCFCVTDPHGNRACTPPGCGANIPKHFITPRKLN